MAENRVERIVFWNVRAGGGRRVAQIADALGGWRPDVVALCEFRATAPSLRLAELVAGMGLSHQLTTADGRAPAANRLLLASRRPLRRVRLQNAPRERGQWLLAEIAVERPYALGVMHVPNQVTGRKYVYHNAVLEVVRRWRRGPALLVGDTNTGRIGLDEEAPVFGIREDGWMTALDGLGWRDGFRHLHGEARAYTWYSPNGRNGFRLDQAFVNRRLLPRLLSTRYEWAVRDGSERRDAVSDHAALIVELAS